MEILETNKALIQNTFAIGVASSLIFNREVAIICMVANVALSLLTQQQEKVQCWFKWNSRVVQEYWKSSLPLLCLSIFFNSFPKKHLWLTLHHPNKTIWKLFQICILAPIVEEIFFRGFLQEKIRNIQVLLSGTKSIDSTVNKVMRIFLQAYLFSIGHAHYKLIVGLLGGYFGYLKEKTSSLLTPIAAHAYFNAAGVATTVARQLLM